MFCSNCAKELSNEASVCPNCGHPQTNSKNSNLSAVSALLLCLFLGGFGAHRFYVGKIGSGIAMLILTLTFVGIIISGIWAFVDLIYISTGNFEDKNNTKLKF